MKSESTLEKYLIKRIKEEGGQSHKMLPTFEAGMPDRIVLLNAKTAFVELKKTGKKPRKLQVQFLKELEKQGHDARVIDTKEQVEQLITDMKK